MRLWLGGMYPMLPQREPILDLIQLPKEKFSSIMKYHRNVLIADIGNNERNLDTRTEARKEVYARDQLMYTIHALDSTAFLEELDRVSYTIQQQIREKDISRMQEYIRGVEDGEIRNRLKEEFQLELSLHKDFNWAGEGDDWVWLTRERIEYLSGTGHDVKQGIFIYTYPYTSDSLFQIEQQMALRDSLLGPRILSALGDSMRVETLLPAEGRNMEWKGQFAYEMRGLWRYDNPIMGGPFVSWSLVDSQNQRVITVDSYVFAPKFDKRDYVVEMEAVIRSLVF